MPIQRGRGTNAWVSIPDGVKAKDLSRHTVDAGVCHLRADGWYLPRSDIIWAKPNPTCQRASPTGQREAHEYLFLLSKSGRYYYDAEAIAEAANPEYASRYGYGFNVGPKESNEWRWPAQIMRQIRQE